MLLVNRMRSRGPTGIGIGGASGSEIGEIVLQADPDIFMMLANYRLMGVA